MRQPQKSPLFFDPSTTTTATLSVDDDDMYSGSSPQFEAQDFPALRRIKPLPKRRRTSNESAVHDGGDQLVVVGDAQGAQIGPYGAEDANGHLTQDIFKNTPAGRAFLSTLDNYYLAAAAGGPGEDDDQGEGDYIDHLQQPNNTKKRKVPTAPHQAHNSGDALPDDDPSGDRPATTKLDADDGEPAVVTAAAGGGGGRRRARASAITIAGLQHKDLIKTRKRQLASVLGTIAPGDELALDQALVARYPTVPGATFGIPKPADFIPVRTKRLRRHKAPLLSAEPVAQAVAMAEGAFSFEAASASSERLVAVRAEMADLYACFEAELTRIATKAAEAAKLSALALAESPKRALTTRRGASNAQNEPPATGAKGRQSKKKKRSALANASNPHHLRNYVPSRLPHSGQAPSQTQAFNPANYLGPPPVRFLTAEVPPKRRRRSTTTAPAAGAIGTLTNPAEEWICPFCEYNLFFGDDAAFRRAIKSRKKILQRRRRARERAAAAASGVAPVAPAPATDKPVTGETHVAEETLAAGDLSAVKNVTKRDRDKGGSGPTAAV